MKTLTINKFVRNAVTSERKKDTILSRNYIYGNRIT